MLSTLTDEYSSIASNQLISKLFKHSKCQSRKKNALNMLHVSIKKKKNHEFCAATIRTAGIQVCL